MYCTVLRGVWAPASSFSGLLVPRTVSAVGLALEAREARCVGRALKEMRMVCLRSLRQKVRVV